MQTVSLSRVVLILLFLFLVFAGLHYTRPFLVPFSFGGLLAMLFYPFARWLESKGVARGLSSLISVAAFIAIVIAIIFLLSWQFTNVASSFGDIENKIMGVVSDAREMIENKFGISRQQQKQLVQQQAGGGAGGASSIVKQFLSGLSGIMVDTVLVLVYIFLFLYFRARMKSFILQLAGESNRSKATKIIYDSSKVAQKYISGLAMMIVMLWIMYAIGFSIVGVENPIFFAILCGTLEIIPFVGNITGTVLTVLASTAQGGDLNLVFGILVTYALVQFIQSYLIEPLVVGSAENINPLFTIIVLVIGELVWGIPGMVLALPLVGIVKVICDNIDPLKPYAYLIGNAKKDSASNKTDKIKSLFKKIKS